jgi:hypothetical protein
MSNDMKRWHNHEPKAKDLAPVVVQQNVGGMGNPAIGMQQPVQDVQDVQDAVDAVMDWSYADSRLNESSLFSFGDPYK